MFEIIKKLLEPFSDIEYGKVTINMGICSVIGFLAFFMIIGEMIIYLGNIYKSTNVIAVIIRIMFKFILICIVANISSGLWAENKPSMQWNRIFNKKIVLYCILVLFGYRLLFGSTIFHILKLIPENDVLTYFDEIIKKDTLFVILEAVFLAPLKEEFLMRGIICNGLSKRYSNTVAILLSAIIFAVIHGNIHQGVNAFLLGIGFGYIYLKTKSLYLTTILHMFNNFIVMPLSIQDLLSGTYQIIYSCISAVIGILLLYVFFRRLKNLINTCNSDRVIACESEENL